MKRSTKEPKRLVVGAVVFSIILLTACFICGGAEAQSVAQLPKVVPGEIIVKLQGDGPDAVYGNVEALLKQGQKVRDSLDALFVKNNITSARTLIFKNPDEIAQLKTKYPKRAKRAPRSIEVKTDLSHSYLIKVDPALDLNMVCKEFLADKHVLSCHPNFLFEAQALYEPNDPYFTSIGTWGQLYEDMWTMKRINLINETGESAWDLTRGGETVIAVIDSGADYTHPELADNIWVNTKEIPENGIDDDNNGYVDDIRGWNFAGNDNEVMDSDFGHGTWVSGIIAAKGNNSYGIIGVAPEAKIMPLKTSYSPSNLSPISELIAAIDYALENGADIINISLSSSVANYSVPALEDAIKLAHSQGMIVIVAAGNMNSDVKNYSPANMTETITVGATNYYDQKAKFRYAQNMTAANYGIYIDVVAPGVDALTINPIGQANLLSNAAPQLAIDSQYYRAQGTSMSAAFVSGLASLIVSKNPGLTNEDVRHILRASPTELVGEYFNRDHFGYGLINVLNALSFEKVPGVQIVSPIHKGQVNVWDEIIPVEVSVYGSNFTEYNLSFTSINNPEGWVDITGTTILPSDSSVVGEVKLISNWDIRSLGLGTFIIRAQLKTGAGFNYESVVQVEIANLNKPPDFGTLGSFKVMVGSPLSFSVAASDPDGDALILSAVNLPEGAIFSDGILSWTPLEGQSGIYSVQFTAFDGKDGNATSEPVSIAVDEPLKDNPPEIKSLTVDGKVVTWSGIDKEDKHKIKFSFNVDNSAWSKPKHRTHKTIESLENKFKLNPGVHTFSLKAFDKAGNESKVKSVQFTIKDKPKAKDHKPGQKK
ncbi:MAG: S8 family serine peptidase [Candidatus Omnitrophica bacterium]|nr:S8 family serine peptidase [Candidatus Omnitrophota bacterium]